MDNDIFCDFLCDILSKCPSLNNKSSKNDYFCFFRIGYTNIYHTNMQNTKHNQILRFKSGNDYDSNSFFPEKM